MFENKEEKSSKENIDQITLSDIAHKRLGITTQMASYYLDGLGGYPNLGGGLRVKRSSSIHSWEMPKDDAEEFIHQVEEYRKKALSWRPGEEAL